MSLYIVDIHGDIEGDYEIVREYKELRCMECKWWKDSDGKYRRGVGAESQCPINSHKVYSGAGYCYMFSPKSESEEEDGKID